MVIWANHLVTRGHGLPCRGVAREIHTNETLVKRWKTASLSVNEIFRLSGMPMSISAAERFIPVGIGGFAPRQVVLAANPPGRRALDAMTTGPPEGHVCPSRASRRCCAGLIDGFKKENVNDINRSWRLPCGCDRHRGNPNWWVNER